MIKFLNNFRKDEDGAVTVDWVVLTAAVVGLAIAAYTTIQQNTADLVGQAASAVGTEGTNWNADLTDLTNRAAGGAAGGTP